MSFANIKKGDEVFLVRRNYSRTGVPSLSTAIVTSVGPKYITVGEGYGATRFHKSSGAEKTDYSPMSHIYISREHWEAEKRAGELRRKLSEVFGYGRSNNLTVDQMESILKIVEESR